MKTIKSESVALSPELKEEILVASQKEVGKRSLTAMFIYLFNRYKQNKI